MNQQMSLARGGFDRFGKQTKRAKFLAEMDAVLPWAELCALIEPHSEARPRPASCGAGAHAAHSLPAALVQPQ